jgi:hypothetical protein
MGALSTTQGKGCSIQELVYNFLLLSDEDVTFVSVAARHYTFHFSIIDTFGNV